MPKLKCIDGIKRRFTDKVFFTDQMVRCCEECSQDVYKFIAPVINVKDIDDEEKRSREACRVHICTTGRITELVNDLIEKRKHIKALKAEYGPIKERHEQAEAEDSRRWELIHEINDYAAQIRSIKKKLGIEEKKK